MIELSAIALSLPSAAGNVDILNGIDLKVEPGESLGLTGPSGSGKTSLLLLIAGLERASRGRLHIAGRDFGALGEDDRALFRRRHIGIVFQSFHLIPGMSAIENVAIPLELAGRRDALARAAALLEAVGLGHRRDHLPAQLSGGEQQRVALARALAPAPDIILADEPTGNLDSANGAKIVDLLFGLQKESGASLILVTHDSTLAARCDRVAHLVDGRLQDRRAA